MSSAGSKDFAKCTELKLLHKLVDRRAEFIHKYLMINMVKLVKDNCQDEEDVRKLISGLEVLSMYSANLLNPHNIRPQKWLSISFHNSTFMNKVLPIKGHRQILEQIGYSKEVRGSLVYDQDFPVQHMIVAQIYLELKAIQMELSLWLERKHPHPDLFQGLIPSSDYISPNVTLTQANAQKFLERQRRRVDAEGRGGVAAADEGGVRWRRRMAGVEAAHTTILVMNRSRSSSGKRLSSLDESPRTSTHESDSLGRRTAGQELPECQAVVEGKWCCDHCSYLNDHPPTCSGRIFHVCVVCSKTSEVDCIQRDDFSVERADVKMAAAPYGNSKEDAKEEEEEEEGGHNSKNKKKLQHQEEKINLEFDEDEDFETRMSKMEKMRRREKELLRRGRMMQFIKVLHSRLPRPVPEEEIEFLFTWKLEPVLERGRSVGFDAAVEDVLGEWEETQGRMVELLRSRGVYREDHRGRPCLAGVRGVLVRHSGDLTKAVGPFMKNWSMMLDRLTEECRIPDLSVLDYSSALFYGGGSVEVATGRLITDRYLNDTVGPGEEAAADDTLDLYRDARLFDPLVNRKVKDREVPREKRARMLMCECDLDDPELANKVVQMIDSSPPSPPARGGGGDDADDGLCVVDFLEALEVDEGIGGDICVNEARKRLTVECKICCERRPDRSFLKMLRCDCRVCRSCVKRHFETKILESNISSLSCPECQQPKIDNGFSDSKYFALLTKLLTGILDKGITNLLGTKLAEWALQDDQVIRCPWPDCNGVFTLGDVHLRGVKVNCPFCAKMLCTNCHCKFDGRFHDCNDSTPTGVIACPKCKQNYHLIDGGCLHITCTQCGHEFCCECRREYSRSCTKFSKCSSLGMHCHHPRDCFFYIRDLDVRVLHKFLGDSVDSYANFAQTRSLPTTSSSSSFRTPNASLARSSSSSVCQGKVQNFNSEETCGQDVCNTELGLCRTHYLKHLYEEMRSRRLDPVHVMGEVQLAALLESHDVKFSRETRTDDPRAYRAYLMKMVQAKLPLRGSKASSGSTESSLPEFNDCSISPVPSSSGAPGFASGSSASSSNSSRGRPTPRGHPSEASPDDRMSLDLREDEQSGCAGADQGMPTDVPLQPHNRLLA